MSRQQEESANSFAAENHNNTYNRQKKRGRPRKICKEKMIVIQVEESSTLRGEAAGAEEGEVTSPPIQKKMRQRRKGLDCRIF
ncbi:hypothetical protein L6164_014059 [Bauhinia variegata]|uniref:Uncharacterized protein n=1 Tax=Bauhinia variegata TaxID=167791 RepID=A0ACB9NGE7_BAUVA|nr:hypothetical protein L6164_014059 [Bauhinia variegata]